MLKSMSWTRNFTGTMIDHNPSGIDHGRRGLAPRPGRPSAPVCDKADKLRSRLSIWRRQMLTYQKAAIAAMLLTCGVLKFACSPAEAAVRIEGHAQVGGGPLA